MPAFGFFLTGPAALQPSGGPRGVKVFMLIGSVQSAASSVVRNDRPESLGMRILN